MDKKINEYRDTVFVVIGEEIVPIEFDKWGAGELKISSLPKINTETVGLYIPYLTFSTLEKAYVLKKFLNKLGIGVLETIIGYFSYSRQERETENEPELLNGILTAAQYMLGNLFVIDGHNKESFNINKVTNGSILKCLLNNIKEEYLIVAPDKGAKARNKELNIETHICLNKCRRDGQVNTELGEVSKEVVDGKTFVILDDICDGGRTFANAATILKEHYPNCKVILTVAHAILPFGVELLQEKGIDQIISSDTCFPVGEYYNGFLKIY